MMNWREEMPWNYCDYRCEVCECQCTCQVYHAVESERRILMAEGKDPDDVENVIESVAANLSEILIDLRAKVREAGMDPDHLPEEDPRARNSGTAFRKDPLYQKAYTLTLRTLKFVGERPVFPAEDRIFTEAWNDLSWHCTVFSAKIARALGGLARFEEGAECGPPDHQISLGIALKSIQHCTNALSVLRGTLPGGNRALDEIQAAFADVRETARERFAPRTWHHRPS